MTYTVLARKYRPETFKDVVGQEWISKTLTNAIQKDRVAHAFLFSGPRGVGKTSMARIFSKALNCEKGPTPKPCMKCTHCVSIAKGNDVDVAEVDAASNRGIDHIRALRENVRYVPASSRFKIYIIDEVHMLTMESFNALLKTLEEPPGHVKFIFATTEPQKMPETVRSRCQCYEFKRISNSDIASRLVLIAKRESIKHEEGVLQRIAVLSRGSLRDAESLLDQVASLGEGSADFEALNSLTGRLSPAEVGDLVDAILTEDAPQIIDFVARAFDSGTQGEDLLKDLIDYWRALMMAAAGSRKEVSNILPGLEERCLAQAEKTDLDRTLTCLQIAFEALRRGRWFDDERILTEMALLKMARLSFSVELSGLLNRLGEGDVAEMKAGKTNPGLHGPLVTGTGKGPPPPSGPIPDPSAPPRAKAGPPETAGLPPVSGSSPAFTPEVPSVMFTRILQEIEKKSKTSACFLKRLEVKSFQNDTFELLDPSGEVKSFINPESDEVRRKLEVASQTVFGRLYKFTVKKTMKAGSEEIPPIVKKARDLFEGDLI